MAYPDGTGIFSDDSAQAHGQGSPKKEKEFPFFLLLTWIRKSFLKYPVS
jgi:hypothetical protein